MEREGKESNREGKGEGNESGKGEGKESEGSGQGE
jgi:hypothetical protein